ncbi:hypothetical protein BGZ70_000787 [Mortierella alpina]|uniref:C2H2-type domain-containing protein n=1 Tax=Mortierella alpina TaxID=64518 RepID=A0A9P6LYD1_MORAP|nr:hypothetical protein BGZ70_000787 [Mortierella alpina]
MSYSSASSSPSPSQQFHHMQILGNHPVSPQVAYSFLDSNQVASNVLFADSAATSLMAVDSIAASPAAEDCQASNQYMYSQQGQQHQRIKSEFPNDQFAAIAHSYMSSMARSFSDQSLPGSYNNAAATTGAGSSTDITIKSEMYDSPLMYSHQGMYEDEYASSESMYSAHMNQHHHNHHYSTSSLSTFMLINMVKPTPKRSRGRRVSTSQPDNVSGGKLFTCHFDDCGKIFKRSEHLKRHVRSIHTQEKPFGCPIHNCTKRFSRSDNLNQHIRIHRHNNSNSAGSRGAHDKSTRSFASFTPFLHGYSGDLITM